MMTTHNPGIDPHTDPKLQWARDWLIERCRAPHYEGAINHILDVIRPYFPVEMELSITAEVPLRVAYSVIPEGNPLGLGATLPLGYDADKDPDASIVSIDSAGAVLGWTRYDEGHEQGILKPDFLGSKRCVNDKGESFFVCFGMWELCVDKAPLVTCRLWFFLFPCFRRKPSVVVVSSMLCILANISFQV